MQITSWTGSPTSILPEYPTGPEPGGVRFGPDAQRETNLAVRAARVGTWVTCYHPARVGTGKSDPVLSRVEPVAHVSRQLGRVKVTRRPVLAGERDVSVSRAFRVGDPDLASHQGCRPAVPKPRPPPGGAPTRGRNRPVGDCCHPLLPLQRDSRLSPARAVVLPHGNRWVRCP